MRARHHARSMARVLATVTVLAIAMVVPATTAFAATIDVTTFNDEYDTGAACSLREASVAASTDAPFGGCPAGSGNDEITLHAGVYELSIEGNDENFSVDGDVDFFPESGDGVTVRGAGMDATFVDGNGSEVHERVFDVRDGDATFQDLSVRNGNGVPNGQRGGGIFYHADGLLTVERVSVHANDTSTRGGGIAVGNGDADIIDSEIANNEATCCDGDGGGLYVDDGFLFMSNTAVVNNYAYDFGGGIKAWGAGVEIENSVISGNSVANGDGGGLWLQPPGQLQRSEGLGFDDYQLTDTTISGNTSAGDGGGLFVEGCCGAMGIFDSTIADNAAQYGGGIYNNTGLDGGATFIQNVTLSSNYAHFNGGGIYNNGSLGMNHATIYRNRADECCSGGGFYDNTDNTVVYQNSIIAKNTPDDCVGSSISAGNNLLGDGSCPNDSGGDDTDIYTTNGDIDPRLGALRDNGGPTKTHALLPGSLAIDNASTDEDCPAEDQRGLTRPTGSFCDIGAYEVGDLTEVLGTDLSQFRCRRKDPTILGTPGNDTLVGTSGADVIQGREGVDNIRGLGGNDIICGGRGNDSMKGNGGNDILKGLRGTDAYKGGSGRDLCIPGPGDDTYSGCEAPPQTT
jgi:hypothetical protein